MQATLSTLKTHKHSNSKSSKVNPKVVTVNTWQGVTQVIDDYRTFKTIYSNSTNSLIDGYGFFIAFDDPPKHLKDAMLMHEALYGHKELLAEWTHFYGRITRQLILEKSTTLVGRRTRTVDIVKDVVNYVPVHLASTYVGGFPLKTAATPRGLHTEQEMYQFLATAFAYIFLSFASGPDPTLEDNSKEVAKLLRGYIKDNIDACKTTNPISEMKSRLLDWYTGADDISSQFLRNLAQSGRPTDQLTDNVFGIVVASSANFSMAAALIVNFYLDDKRKTEREDVIKLCHEDTPCGNAKLLGYIMEALRLDPQSPGIVREAACDAEIREGNGLPSVKVQKGQRVFVSLQNADVDPSVFGKDPFNVDPTRPLQLYRIFGDGMHACLGRWFVQSMMPQVIRTIFTLKNIRRTPGPQGQLNRFRNVLYETTLSWLYHDLTGKVSPWPASMVIEYDY